MTAPEREALVKALRDSSYFAPRELLLQAADMIEALAPAVTVTEEMVEAAAKAMAGYEWDATSILETPNGETPDELHGYWLGKAEIALQAASVCALKSTTPQTGSQE